MAAPGLQQKPQGSRLALNWVAFQSNMFSDPFLPFPFLHRLVSRMF